MTASRIVLAITWIAGSLLAFMIAKMTGARIIGKRKIIFVAAIVIWTAFVSFLDWWAPRPQLTNIQTTTIHERPADWRIIEDWQKTTLAAAASQYPNNTLHIVASSLSDEAWDYANQFKDLFSRSGWKIIGPESAPLDQPAIDIQLSVSEKYCGVARPEAFTAIDSTLRFVGIKKNPSVVVDPLVNPDELIMWVGAKGPPGLPQGKPLQLITMKCSAPLQFSDDTMHFIGDPTAHVRFVQIRPTHSRFIAGAKFLVLLTGVAISVATDESFQVQSLGKVMPRPDVLDVSVSKDLRVGEPILMKIISKEEIRVRCVQDRSI